VINADTIKPHMPVVCSEGGQFAIVDHLEGRDSIKLAKDKSGQHHYIPTKWVTSVDDKVHVDRPGDRAMKEWSTSPKAGDATADPTHTERVRSQQTDKNDKADPTKDPQRAERLKSH
jgi:hypothetical protein